jgi:hypothetical protein
MNEKIDRSVWTNYFDDFTSRNQLRLTRLEVFGENGTRVEEAGLPFAGISLERGNGAPSIEITLGGSGIRTPHLTHLIEDVRKITPRRGSDGRDEALEIVDGQSEISLLSFEPQRMVAELKIEEWSWCKSPFEFLSFIKLPSPNGDNQVAS